MAAVNGGEKIKRMGPGEKPSSQTERVRGPCDQRATDILAGGRRRGQVAAKQKWKERDREHGSGGWLVQGLMFLFLIWYVFVSRIRITRW